MNKKKSILLRLFAYAGNFKYFTILGMIFSGISSIMAILPIYYIFKVAKEVIMVYPNYQNSENITLYAILAVIFACSTMITYLIGLLLFSLIVSLVFISLGPNGIKAIINSKKERKSK